MSSTPPAPSTTPDAPKGRAGRESSPLTHDRATAASLGLLRIWVFGIWLVEVALDPISRMTRLPAELFDPPGLAGLLPPDEIDWVLNPALLTMAGAVLVAGLVAVVLGAYRRPWVPGIVVVGLVAHQALVRSFGSMGHAELALLYVSALLCLFPLADGLALRRRPPREVRSPQLYAAPFVLAGLVLSLTYFGTAAARMWKGLDLFTTSTMRDLVALQTIHGDGLFGWGRGVPAMLVRTVPLGIWQAAYVGTTILELAFPLVMVSRTARRALVPTMIAFHLLSWPLLGLRFFENILLMVVFSEVTFHRVAARLERKVEVSPARPWRTGARR
jgi:hypothetical protein